MSDLAQKSSELSALRGEQVTLERLEQQIGWYDKRSRLHRRLYKTLKTMTMGAATVIPVLATSAMPYGAQLAAGLGLMITVLEGIQHLNQWQANWASYRMTAEALAHEQFAYLGQTGPYLKAENAHALLAERMRSLISQENSKWFSSQVQAAPNDPTRSTRGF